MVEEKHCVRCGRTKKDGVKFYTNKKICSKCVYEQKMVRIYDMKELYYSYLEKSSCKHCGIRNPLVLQFHHKNDDKVLGISEMIKFGYSWKRIEAEMEKCDVYCANCHSIITVAEADNTKLQRFSEYIPHELIEMAL